jgi:hypothetical protein
MKSRNAGVIYSERIQKQVDEVLWRQRRAVVAQRPILWSGGLCKWGVHLMVSGANFSLEATIHKTGISLEVSTVNSETIGIRHYCRDCYGRAVQKIEQPEKSEQEQGAPPDSN